MENVYYNAYTEIYEILSYMPINYIKKLPIELLNLFEQNRNKEYKYCIDIEKKINEQEMLIETKSILAVLYRDYWATPEKKEIILQNEKNERDLYQNELRRKYNPDNIFKNSNQSQNIIQDDDSKDKTLINHVAIVEHEESILKKIINKIKNIFGLH